MVSQSEKLTIAYSGTLSAYEPQEHSSPKKLSGLQRFRKLLQVYKVHNVTWETRTGYYLFQGVKEFVERYPELRGSLHISMWGNIFAGNSKQIQQLGLKDVISVDGFVSRSEMLERLEASDVLFLPLESAKNGQAPLHIPGKLYDYLSLGKPVWALAEDSDCKEFLTKAGVGIFSDPFDKVSIAESLKYLVENKSQLPNLHQANWEYINSNFRYNVLTEQLAQIIHSQVK